MTGRRLILALGMSIAGMSLGVMAGARLVPESAATADTTGPPPSLPCSVVGDCTTNTGPPPPTSSTPPPQPKAPLGVTDLRSAPLAGHGLRLTWKLPAGGPAVAAVLVRRAPKGACAESPGAGTAVGGPAVRTHQIDPAARNGVSYCYSVFTETSKRKYSPATTIGARHGFPAPGAVTGLSSQISGGRVTLSWTNPAGISGIAVVRGAAGGGCPATPAAGTAIGPRTARSSQVDATAQRGKAYCYSVFALGQGATQAAAAHATGVTVPASGPAPKPNPQTKPAPSTSALDSTLVRVVGAVVGGVITFALVLLLGLRLLPGGRGGSVAAPQPYATANGRLHLESVEPAALVIPALMVVLAVGLAVVAAFLLL